MGQVITVIDVIVHNPIRATIALAMALALAVMLLVFTNQTHIPIVGWLFPEPNADRPTSQQLAQAKSHFQQGLTFAAMGLVDEGIQEFNAAIGLDSKYAAAYGNRGAAYMTQGKYNKALEDLRNAVQIDPKDRNAYYNLAALHTLRQEFDLAIDALEQALKHGFHNYDVLRRDTDLEGLRRQPEFRRLLERHKISL
jgi:tetratricopeptide (TPR) repeat protein